MTHDYKRNGMTTLFAALNLLDGTVIGRCMRRHRHQEFIRFLIAQLIPARSRSAPIAFSCLRRIDLTTPPARPRHP
jgi:hypothetical protein